MTTYHFPKYRLAGLLRQPGGKFVAEALRDAEAAVVTLRDRCLAYVDDTLAQMTAAQAELVRGSDALALRTIYDASNSLVGVAAAGGLVALDRAAYSLCDMTDRMIQRGTIDTEVIKLHVDALRLFRGMETSPVQVDVRSVLEGLRQVRDRYQRASADTSREIDRAQRVARLIERTLPAARD